MKNVNKNAPIFLFIALLAAVSLCIFAVGCGKAKTQEVGKAKKISYWTCGMHPSVRVTDAEHKKGTINCPICNMGLIPVYKSEETGPAEAAQNEEEYRYGCGVKEEGHCPHCDEGKTDAQCICDGHSFMMTPDKSIDKSMTCPVCGKPLKRIAGKDITDSSEASTISRLKLNSREIELAGIAAEPVTRHALKKTLRTVGKVAFDPGLSIAQEEFLTALETREKVGKSTDPDVIKRADDLVERSRFKLKLLGMDEAEIVDLEGSGKAQMELVLPQKKAWVYADVYEYELGWVKTGQEASITATAYPGEVFNGVVRSISPVIEPMTRSAKVRIEVENTGSKLQPEMYVDVIIESKFAGSDGSEEALTVPKSAVLDTGTRKIVYVDDGGGTYIGRQIKTGPLGEVTFEGGTRQFYPVLSGLAEGDMVVTKANFLLDSQSQLVGAASAAYGGAIGAKEDTPSQVHQH